MSLGVLLTSLYELEFKRGFFKAAVRSVSRAVRLRECPLRELRLYIDCLFVTVFVSQGQKGAPGSPAKPPHGAIKFSDTAENCTLNTAGTVRYSTSQNSLQLCDGSSWLPLAIARNGHVTNNPGRHCLDILNAG